jgi:hypothetical protein
MPGETAHSLRTVACYHRIKYHEKDAAQHHLFSGDPLHVTNPTKSTKSHSTGEPPMQALCPFEL